MENGRKWIFACFESWPSRWLGRQWSKMVENGRKWWKMVENGFPRVSRRGHRGDQAGNGRNGRKWWKMDFRGKMVENGFPRVIRHSPTT